MEVEVYGEGVDISSVQKAAILVLTNEKISCNSLIVHFVSKEIIGEIHQEFFGDSSPTDCITFPIDLIQSDLSCDVLGEIFVCIAVAEEYSKKYQLPVDEEVTLYLVHGILHLLGFDDQTPQEKGEMRKKEKCCMQFLREHNAIIRLVSS